MMAEEDQKAKGAKPAVGEQIQNMWSDIKRRMQPGGGRNMQDSDSVIDGTIKEANEIIRDMRPQAKEIMDTAANDEGVRNEVISAIGGIMQ